MPECFKPYDDEFMSFNKITHQYILTEKALLSKGIDIRARMAATATVSPENVIQTLVETVSDMIYQYIHDQSMDNDSQDWLIAHNPRLRQLIQRAMFAQAVLSTWVIFTCPLVWKTGRMLLIPSLRVCLTMSFPARVHPSHTGGNGDDLRRFGYFTPSSKIYCRSHFLAGAAGQCPFS